MLTPPPPGSARTLTRDESPEAPTEGGPPRLVVVFAPSSGDVGREVSPGELGREAEQTLPDARMSRRHVRFSVDGRQLFVTDLNSKNGTVVNGRRIAGPTALSANDVVRVGDTLLVADPPIPSAANGLGDDLKLVGQSSAMAELRAAVRQYARDRNPVVILGPTGTGKELVASALHNLSGRSGPWVPVNCATIAPRDLASSMLFGHERGAFTGASERRQGFVREADRGTLFLDELGELPLDAQALLLRALQERKVRSVGGQRDEQVDVRVLGATHAALGGDSPGVGFREDLWYRLATLQINVPPLSARRVDILALFAHFAHDLPPLDPATAEVLCGRAWSGNVRELQGAALRAEIHSRGGPRVLPEHRALPPDRTTSAEGGVGRPTIDEALRQTGGNRAQAAKLAGVDRSTVYRHLGRSGSAGEA